MRIRAIGSSAARTAAWAAVAALALAGCASTPPEQFYRLGAPASGVPGGAIGSAVGSAASPVIDVGPVALPELYDRPQLVTGGAGSQVEIAEGHRWAEPLRFAIGRVVAEQLARALGTPFVRAYPQAALGTPTLRVSLQVQRFDAEAGVAVRDALLWTVRRTADGAQRSGRGEVDVPVAGPGYAALPDAHAAALAAITQDIARAAAELAPR